MCGINGIINFNNSKVKEEKIELMNKLIKHRGPDSDGTFIDGNVGLGHVRLSIIDLSDAGAQPFFSIDKKYIIIFNGEIYNYIELKEDLLKKGYEFKSSSDTEVLLNMYIEYKEKCLDYLNGMFSFCIYEKENNKIFLARDRIGIKPLYFYKDDKQFIFSSEIKSLIKSDLVKAEIDTDGLLDYLHFQFTLGERTMFENVKQLLPAHYIKIDINNDKIETNEYWRLEFETQEKNDLEKYKIDVLDLIEDSVKIRLRSDVTVGAHLSGGIDSSTTTTLAAKNLDNKIKTFTGAFRDHKGYDESEYAKIVSKKADCDYKEIEPTFEDFKDYIKKIIYHMDYPVVGPGVFPQYMLCKLIHDNDVKVVLGGQGGDELFGGYTRYLIAYFEQCIKGSIFESEKKGDFIVTLQSIIPNLSSLKQYVPMLKKFWSKNLFEEMDQRYYDLIIRMDNVENIINFDKKDYDPLKEYMNVFHNTKARSYIDKMLHFDLKTLLPSLLHVEDRTSMAFGIESRVPLLDYRLVELSTKVSPKNKFKDGKTKLLLKEAVKDILPEEIVNRKDKMGFPVPLYEWFNNELKDWIQELLNSEDSKIQKIIKKEYILEKINSDKKFGREVWGLLCLELWMREYFE